MKELLHNLYKNIIYNMVHFGLIPDGNRRWCKERNINLDELPNIWKDFLLKLIKEFGKLDLKNYKEFEQINEISIYLASIDNVFRKDNTKYILHNIIKKVIDIINYPEEYIDKDDYDFNLTIKDKKKNEKKIVINIGNGIVYNGDKVIHKVSKQCKDGERITLIINLTTNIKYNFILNWISLILVSF